MKGGDLKKNVWKPFPVINLILHSKQMTESIWDESKSQAFVATT